MSRSYLRPNDTALFSTLFCASRDDELPFGSCFQVILLVIELDKSSFLLLEYYVEHLIEYSSTRQ